MICTPEYAERVIGGSQKSKYSSNNDIKVLCLGAATGCQNLFELLEDIREEDSDEPVGVQDAEKDNLIVFWSSGTTGTIILLIPYC